jgi:hypothetical protein
LAYFISLSLRNKRTGHLFIPLTPFPSQRSVFQYEFAPRREHWPQGRLLTLL